MPDMLYSTLKTWNQYKRHAYRDKGVGPFKQMLQIGLWGIRGFTAKEYYIYPLYDIDPRPVLTSRRYRKERRKINKEVRGIIAVDKWLQSAVWSANEIPHPRTHGYVLGGAGVWRGRRLCGDPRALLDGLSQAPLPLVVKPLNGSNGKGFDIIESFDRQTGCLKLAAGGSRSGLDFCAMAFAAESGFLFQEKIDQHPAISAIFPNCVNTIRVITLKSPDGRIEVVQAMAKFGGGDDLVDNNAMSGVIARVDLQTGKLGEARKRFGTGVFDHHPDTGERIAGVVLPWWDETRQLAEDAHSLLPAPRHLGWDIAVARRGPLVVEMNGALSIAVNQKIEGAMAKGFGV